MRCPPIRNLLGILILDSIMVSFVSVEVGFEYMYEFLMVRYRW